MLNRPGTRPPLSPIYKPGARNEAPGVYRIEEPGATAKPEGMTGGAMRSLGRIERNLE